MALRLPPLRFGPLSQNAHCMSDGEEILNRFLLEDLPASQGDTVL